MSKRLVILKSEAIKLRLQGKSYSQIKKELGISKSTLSGWLKNYPLSPERIKQLRDFSEQRIESFRNTMRKKRETRQDIIYQREKKYLLPFSKKEWYIGGLFLYWGEGLKATRGTFSLSNTNPQMIMFYVNWIITTLNVKKEKISIRLHLYSDMDEVKETNYWSELLKVPTTQFLKPYIKPTTLSGLTYKSFGHGTCNVMVNNTSLTEKILFGIKAISDQYHLLRS